MLQVFTIMTIRICVVATLFLCSCTVVPRLRSHEEHFPNGRLKVRYQYYVDAAGGEVKDGKLVRWDDHGLVGSEEIYKDGKLISSTRIIKNQ